MAESNARQPAHAVAVPPIPYPTADTILATKTGRADILALGFGTTVVMWALGFICRLPGTATPGWVLFAAFLACLFTGGFIAGAYSQRGVRGGLYTGLLAGVLNLLILGSLLASDQPNRVAASALIWIPGSLVVAMAVAASGALFAANLLPKRTDVRNWPATFALVAGLATLILLAVGGSVTGFDYGLAVVDWPNTEGYNMFLYPLARMTGGIYYEHSHRLIGSLVGLTTLVLTLYLQITEKRRWLKTLAWIALAMVVVQGILGGLRVTGRFTLSTSPNDTAPSIVLAIVHGVFGQMFFATVIAIAVFLTMPWKVRRDPLFAAGASTDRTFGIVLVAMLFAQLILGALVRHLSPALRAGRYGISIAPDQLVERGTWALHLHITIAVLVLVLALAVGVRQWGLYQRMPLLRRLGVALLILVGLQVVLGLAALLVVGHDAPPQPPTPLDVLITTGHQTVGAVLLALAVAIVLYDYRLLTSRAPGAAHSAGS